MNQRQQFQNKLRTALSTDQQGPPGYMIRAPLYRGQPGMPQAAATRKPHMAPRPRPQPGPTWRPVAGPAMSWQQQQAQKEKEAGWGKEPWAPQPQQQAQPRVQAPLQPAPPIWTPPIQTMGPWQSIGTQRLPWETGRYSY